MVGPVEPSHGCCMGLTHHKKSIDMALKGFLMHSSTYLFISYVQWAYCMQNTAFVRVVGEGFVGKVIFEQRAMFGEPEIATREGDDTCELLNKVSGIWKAPVGVNSPGHYHSCWCTVKTYVAEHQEWHLRKVCLDLMR